ncbi:reverse transcriptase domain-containing protein [Tanacetum coccineum]
MVSDPGYRELVKSFIEMCEPNTKYNWERMQIMPPTMTTQSVGRPAATSRGRGTGGRAGRGGGRTRGRSGDQGDGRNDGQGGQQLQNLLPTIVAQVGDQGKGQGNGRNQNGDSINDNIWGDVSRRCTYKEFLACNPREYDGKGGAIVYTCWIEKMESVQDMSRCKDIQKVKYTTGSFVAKALTWWNSQIYTRVREAAIGMSWDDFKTLTREEFCPSNEMQKLETELWNYVMIWVGHAAYTGFMSWLAGTLTDEALRNGSIKKNPGKRGNEGEPSKDRNVRDDNKRTRIGNAFAITTNPVRRENTGHCAKDSRDVPRNVNPVNARNPTARTCYECGSTDHIKPACPRNQARGRAFKLGADEARQDPNVVTGFSYKFEIASGQLVEFDKVIRGCKLEIEGHVFDINLITFGSGSFDVIIGMDWLSNHKAEIIYHKKEVRIPLIDGKVLRVLGEKPEEKMRQLMSVKVKEKKQEEIMVVRDFLEVFPDDLSGLPPVQEIEFRIELIPGAMPVAKSPYHLAPFKLEELSGQLK